MNISAALLCRRHLWQRRRWGCCPVLGRRDGRVDLSLHWPELKSNKRFCGTAKRSQRCKKAQRNLHVKARLMILTAVVWWCWAQPAIDYSTQNQHFCAKQSSWHTIKSSASICTYKIRQVCHKISQVYNRFHGNYFWIIKPVELYHCEWPVSFEALI